MYGLKSSILLNFFSFRTLKSAKPAGVSNKSNIFDCFQLICDDFEFVGDLCHKSSLKIFSVVDEFEGEILRASENLAILLKFGNLGNCKFVKKK